MVQKKKKQKRLVKKIEFKIQDNQSLVIIYCLLPDAGLERVIVENKKGITHVYADGRSRFEFSSQKEHPNQCDFWLSNPKDNVMIEDIIRSKFWSQFTWGELITAQKNQKLGKALNRKIKKLVKEFEEKAAQQLNQLHKQHKSDSKKNESFFEIMSGMFKLIFHLLRSMEDSK